MLRAHHIRAVVDVRRYPVSRRHPHFNTEALQKALAPHDIEYRLLGGLGGRRKTQPDSVNLGWRNESFRGYADYMQTETFRHALESLLSLASEAPTAIMCAEAVPWRCHRRLISDALIARGVEVLHILGPGHADPHELDPNARLLPGGRLLYAGPPEEQRSLFEEGR